MKQELELIYENMLEDRFNEDQPLNSDNEGQSFDDDYITQAGRTARPWKSTAVCKKAVEYISEGDKVLDYGSGPFQKIRPTIEALGAEYIPFDRYNNIGSMNDLHNNDLVMLSNVLNVAVKASDPEKVYYNILHEAIGAAKTGGILVANIPKIGPMADWMTVEKLESDMSEFFGHIKAWRSGVVVGLDKI